MDQNFEIISYVGAEPLLFGMTQSRAEAIVGHPEMITTNGLGEPDASYESFSIRYSKQNKTLVEIGFSSAAHVKIFGMNPFREKDAFQYLLRRDSCPYESFGFIILLNLGITLTGFHDNDPNQLAITAFVRGRWDQLKKELRKFPVP